MLRRSTSSRGARQNAPVSLSDALFPNGRRSKKADRAQELELYRMMVASSESLVTRRQGLNTFFLTLHGVIITAVGFLLGSGIDSGLRSVGLAGVTIVGALLAWAWHSLLVSFGQLNKGKFAVINEMERRLPAAIYTAEWVALGEGKDPKLYRSFTEREVWVPRVLLVAYGVAFAALLVSLAVAHGPGLIAWVQSTSCQVAAGWFYTATGPRPADRKSVV